MFLKKFKPGICAKRYKQQSSMFFSSVMESYLRETLFFQFLRNHIPAPTIFELLYEYPRCGEERVRKVYICSLYCSRWGRAARMINPPKECPMKDKRPNILPGLHSLMNRMVSLARLLPMIMISCSVLSSLLQLQRNSESGKTSEILFRNRRMSKLFPWKPCTSTIMWIRGSLGSGLPFNSSA